jgi:hypothetical protein
VQGGPAGQFALRRRGPAGGQLLAHLLGRAQAGAALFQQLGTELLALRQRQRIGLGQGPGQQAAVEGQAGVGRAPLRHRAGHRPVQHRGGAAAGGRARGLQAQPGQVHIGAGHLLQQHRRPHQVALDHKALQAGRGQVRRAEAQHAQRASSR